MPHIPRVHVAFHINIRDKGLLIGTHLMIDLFVPAALNVGESGGGAQGVRTMKLWFVKGAHLRYAEHRVFMIAEFSQNRLE